MTIWRSLVLSLATLTMGLAGENQRVQLFGDLAFDSDYENGSLGEVTELAADQFACSLYTELGELGEQRYWFRFRLRGAEGRQLTLSLDHTENPRPFIRVGEQPWRRLLAREVPTLQQIVLTLGPEDDEVELAFFEPMGLTEINANLDELTQAAGPFLTRDPLGLSEERRPLEMLTVTNPAIPESEKGRVWVHSRAHAGEVTGTHALLGMLEQCLEESSFGRLLRDQLIIHFVPVLNVDGVARGYTRWDAAGRDPESQWCAIASPAVRAVKERVDALMRGQQPIAVALNLHATRGEYRDSFFFKHLAPSVSERFEGIQQRYIDALDRATPLFDNLTPESSQLHACRFIESYLWSGWGEEVMALTHEGHYYRRLPDQAWLTGADYRELGQAMARAMVDYFDLALPQSVRWTYGRWRKQHFAGFEMVLANLSGPNGDPDRDGYSNLLEYALGTAPKEANRMGAGSLEWREGWLCLERGRDLTDLSWRLETSRDLLHWTSESLLSAQVIALGAERERLEIRLPEASGSQVFARLVVALK